MEDMRATSLGLLRQVFHAYSLSALALVALTVLFPLPWLDARIAWIGIGWFLLAALHFLLSPEPLRSERWEPPQRLIPIALGVLLLLAYLLRVLPQQQTGIPIGYDYGFYRAAMETYEAASPQVPETELPNWIRLQFEPGLLLLHQVLHQVAGLDAYTHLRTVFPLLSALLLVPLYATTRAHFGTGAGLVAAGFYAASFTQYTVHEYLYEKNILALALFLALAFCLHRRRFVLVGVLLGALGIWHRPTFLLAAVGLVVVGFLDYLRTGRIQKWLVAAGLSLPLFLPLWILRRDEYFGLGFRFIQIAGDNVGTAVPEGGGTFLTFLQYQNAAVTYLPLAVAGAVLALRRGRGLLPAVAFLLSFVNVLLHLVFFNRFIIMLDLLSLLLVGAAVVASLPPLSRPWARPVLLSTLILLTALPTIQEATRTPGPPYLWINDEQREGITWIRENTEEEATILGSNLDSPYVIAESRRRTFGPGLFDDPHTGAEWRRFFQTTDAAQVAQHLAVYGRPLYVYHADGHGPGLGTAKFREPQFTLVYDEAGARVWRYEG